MMNNRFYKKKKYIFLNDILSALGNTKKRENIKINDLKDLISASSNDISFLHSPKYLDLAKETKSKYIITHKKYQSLLNKICTPILVNDVLKSVAIVAKQFYPNSLDDAVDFYVKIPKEKDFKNIKFGKNVLVGKNVKIGNKTIIGHNSIIESNVKIGSNCIIGNNVLIKYSIIGNNVRILDGSVIGKKGFGFLPDKNHNIRYPHIGLVVINDNVEIGCNNTIDRGSISNTVIGLNTFIDNQVHIAHNVKIGDNCVITGQVGFAGSSSLGNNVQIGGQAGISGHLNIGNNVKIGGGSGVIKNVPDNSKVMGYPARDIRDFLKENK